MNVTKALQIIRDGLVTDADALETVEGLIQEVANSAYVAGLHDSDIDANVFTAYGKSQDWLNLKFKLTL